MLAMYKNQWVLYSNVQESMGVSYVQESMGASNVQESMGVSYVQESMGVSYVQESMGVSYVQRSMGVSNSHSFVQFPVQGSIKTRPLRCTNHNTTDTH